MDRETELLLQRFEISPSLPPHLAAVALSFNQLAWRIVRGLSESNERLKALDRLLQAKDAALRCAQLSPHTQDKAA